MMRNFPFRLCLFVLLTIPMSGWAQQTYAVIVGVSDYYLGRPGKGDLQFADNDANLFYNWLRSPAGGSVPANHLFLLTNRQASRNNILQAMTLFRQASSSDRIIFYFSGHGDTGMLLPYDFDPRSVTLWHRDVKEAFRHSSAQTKMLLADACMSGSMRVRTNARPAAPAASLVNDKVVVMLSSRNAETSQELGEIRQGAFTYTLLRGASGEADRSRDGIVTMKELYFYMRRNVQAMTRGKQTPVIFGQFDESLPFSYVR